MQLQIGLVNELKLSRERGSVMLKPSGDKFTLYLDQEVDTIDPTEMVRRNWMIGLLQQAAVHQAEVAISYVSETDATVLAVSLHATTKRVPPGSMITTGSVKRVELTPEKGRVTISGNSHPILVPQPVVHRQNHDLLIYTNEGTGLVHAEESHRRTRVVGLVRQALAEGLSVAMTHANEPDAVIYDVRLHAKE